MKSNNALETHLQSFEKLEDALKAYRRENNLSINKLAGLLNVSAITCQKWEKGITPCEKNRGKITELTGFDNWQIGSIKAREIYIKENYPAMSDKEMATALRLSTSYIRKLRKAMGIERRKTRGPKKEQMQNVIKEERVSGTLCWTCQNAVPAFNGKGCKWSREFKPVAGWTAEKRGESYFVKACPKYRKERHYEQLP